MSNSKGSILISNANAVGTALVNKLGGTGYTPNEWSDKINLLGIADADIQTALAGITEGSYTGEDRGAIKICNANNVGTILNKKLNTNRGFKPSEWESAISKLTALTTGTASGSVVTFSDGADDVPLTKCEVTLPASLNGYSQVDVVNCGKNLFDKESANVKTGYIGSSFYIEANPQTRTAYIPIFPNKTYTISKMVSSRFTVAVSPTIPSNNEPFTTRQSDHSADHLTISSGASDKYLWIFFYNGDTDTETIENILSTIQVEIGSSASTFEPYSGETHTAQLGKTIYGGSADIVKGEGTSKYVRIDLGSMEWVNNATYANVFNGTFPYGYMPDNTIDYLCEDYTNGDSTAVITNNMMAAISADRRRLYCHNDSYTQAADFKESVRGKYIVFKCTANEDDFTFDPIPINSKKGNNTIWSDSGSNVSVTYYKGV